MQVLASRLVDEGRRVRILADKKFKQSPGGRWHMEISRRDVAGADRKSTNRVRCPFLAHVAARLQHVVMMYLFRDGTDNQDHAGLFPIRCRIKHTERSPANDSAI